MRGNMWFLNAAHSILEAAMVDGSSRVIEQFEEALSVLIPNERLSVSSKWSRTSF